MTSQNNSNQGGNAQEATAIYYDFDVWPMFYSIIGSVHILGQSLSEKEKKLTPVQISKHIREIFDENDFVVVTERSDDVPVDVIDVAVTYMDINTANGLPDFEIVLMYNTDQKYYFSNIIDWELVAYDLAEGVCREMLAKTYEMNNDDVFLAKKPSNESMRYIGSDVEIKCCAFSIAAESIGESCGYEETSMYQTYVDAFEPDSKVMLKLNYEIMCHLMSFRDYMEELESTDDSDIDSDSSNDTDNEEIVDIEHLSEVIAQLQQHLDNKKK